MAKIANGRCRAANIADIVEKNLPIMPRCAGSKNAPITLPADPVGTDLIASTSLFALE